MSAQKSFLSSPKYGYDFVVATTQASINSGLKEYLDTINQPTTILCFLANEKGNPTVPISLEELKSKTGGIDPFDLPADIDYNDPRVTRLTQVRFAVALKMKIGLPPGILPKNLPPIVKLGSSANNVTFNMFCSEFQVIQNAPPSSWAGGSWNVWSQPAGHPWYFTSGVNLVYADLDKALNTPYFNTHPQEKRELLNKLKNMGADAFSLKQLLFDLDNAILQSTPKIEGLDPSSDAGIVVSRAFINSYFATLKEHGSPVLAVNTVINRADVSPLRLTGMEREVNPFVDDKGVPIPNPSPEQESLTTLNYLCAANGNPLPGAASFDFNWVDPHEINDESGVVAINRNSLATYFGNIIKKDIRQHCIKPSTHIKAWPGGTVEYTVSASPGQEPQKVSVTDNGAEVLVISYESNADAYDKAALTSGVLNVHSSFRCSVSFSGNTIVIAQHLKIWMKVSWDLTRTEGNIINRTLKDTYTLVVGMNGQLEAKLTNSESGDTSQDINIDAFSNFFVNLNSIIKMVTDYVKALTNFNLTNIPINELQRFVFPGAKVFTYKDVQFSDHQDLVSKITYVKPS